MGYRAAAWAVLVVLAGLHLLPAPAHAQSTTTSQPPVNVALDSGTPSTIEVLGVIGTFLAIAVALGLAIAPALVRRRRRPRLAIKLGEQEPYVRPVRDGLDTEAFILRMEVENKGKTAADAVSASVRRWWARADDANYEWVEHDIDPVPLRWTTTPTELFFETGKSTDVIPGGTSSLADLSVFEKKRGRTILIAPRQVEDHEPDYTLVSNYGLGEHRAEVVVTASNADAVTAVVTYTTSHEHWITDVGSSEAPPSGITQKVGLLNLLKPLFDGDGDDKQSGGEVAGST